MTMLAKLLAQTVQARANCVESGNAEWHGRHSHAIHALVRALMPSGSGIDAGTKIDLPASTPDKLVFTTAFHHMDQNGFYDGWTEHTVRVTPTFGGIDIAISGRNRNDVKDLLHGAFYAALMQDVTPERERTITHADAA